MNSTPKISIIVPVYNVEQYIVKCIDSVIAQTYKDYELILVDDGSTDNSGKICDEYALKDNRIKVIHKKNEGVTATRDRGVKEAKGEFLFFIDGDDYITENALELFTNKQKENDADLVRGSFCSIKEDGEIKKHIVPTNTKTIEKYFNYIAKGCWNIWNNLYRASIFKAHVNIPHLITLGEDKLCNIQLLIGIKSIAIVQDITYYYVLRSNSVVHTVYKNGIKEYRIYILLLRELDKVHNIYRTSEHKDIYRKLEEVIATFIILVLIYNKKDMLKIYKKIILKYHYKYFITNPHIQLRIIKKSWKIYLYSIIVLLRLI